MFVMHKNGRTSYVFSNLIYCTIVCALIGRGQYFPHFQRKKCPCLFLPSFFSFPFFKLRAYKFPIIRLVDTARKSSMVWLGYLTSDSLLLLLILTDRHSFAFGGFCRISVEKKLEPLSERFLTPPLHPLSF